jgi:putative transcriptional regulator
MRKNLKQRRLELGLTQEQVAKKVGIDRTSYVHYETGRCIPGLKTALKIKEVLKTKDDSIFLNEEEELPKKVV